MRIFSFVVLLILATHIEATAFPPKFAKSEYLRTLSASVVVENGIVFFSIEFEVTKELQPANVLTFMFPNPTDELQPITEVRKLDIEGKNITVESPPLTSIHNNRGYGMTVEIFADFTKSKKLGAHRQDIEVHLDDHTIEALEILSC